MQCRKLEFKVPLRLIRLCVLGTFLPAILVAGPIYLRYRVYSVQLYPLTISDQRLIDGKISTTWCQRQVVRVNTTFNAYLMSNEPNIKGDLVPVSMTRHLVLEDDMKEYWGFYLLRGSSVTVSTCVRWPGASLTIVRGHKHLHECTFIGDDSSEELEELLQVAEEKGLLKVNGTIQNNESPSNAPDKMTKVHKDVKFHHHNSKAPHKNRTFSSNDFNPSSHELDANAMKNILALLMKKTNEMKNKQKKNAYHIYEGVYRESDNIDKPPSLEKEFDPRDLFDLLDQKRQSLETNQNEKLPKTKIDANSKIPNDAQLNISNDTLNQKIINDTLNQKIINDTLNQKIVNNTVKLKNLNTDDLVKEKKISTSLSREKEVKNDETPRINVENKSKNLESSENDPSSAEVFGEVMKKIVSQGERGKKLFQQLLSEIDDEKLKQRLMIKLTSAAKIEEEKKRRKRDFILSSPLQDELSRDDEDEDAAIEEDLLTPDGIADDRGTVNETTLNDRSNSEFWSSFSSSEERLLECKGLILNLPLTPHRMCTPHHENEHNAASIANTVTYRVPANGYYFFVFNSENEVQTNYLRIKFDLLKTAYNTSNPVHACENITSECSLPFNFFSSERTVLELPVRGNDSQWNEEFVVTSTCEPRTSIYIFCVIAVPLLILLFAFH
ncbi:uncharacterized protein LOC122506891 isoform X2 [Leptopilina heterotoma]|nr:uncharacterized protein LOC122506891 isoform X2 [Leptopilina heterotoma]